MTITANSAVPITPADRVREISRANDQCPDEVLADISRRIEEAAHKGEWGIRVTIEKKYHRYISELLESKGYTVSGYMQDLRAITVDIAW